MKHKIRMRWFDGPEGVLFEISGCTCGWNVPSGGGIDPDDAIASHIAEARAVTITAIGYVEATLEPIVIYRQDGQWWTQPVASFAERVDRFSCQPFDLRTILNPYRHFKGGYYHVVALGRSATTHEPIVIYRSIRDGTWWTRPYDDFITTVIHDGRQQPRFARVPRS